MSSFPPDWYVIDPSCALAVCLAGMGALDEDHLFPERGGESQARTGAGQT